MSEERYGSLLQWQQPTTYFWRPKDDITTLELAKCMTLFVAWSQDFQTFERCYEVLPEYCKRHWEKQVGANTTRGAAGDE